MKNKQKIVVANWKMSPSSFPIAKKLLDDIRRGLKRGSAKVVICPPLIFARELAHSYRGQKISFGAQDISEESGGSFTGEVSAQMVREAGLAYCIVGHSERRARGESETIVNKKMIRSLEAGLSPILCIGERERDAGGRYLATVAGQLRSAFAGVAKKDARKALIAYEPIFAIGGSARDALSPRAIEEMALYIRKLLVEMFGRESGLLVPVLYGGSVEPENGRQILWEGGVDGYLVGHASLSASDFSALVAYAS